MKIVKTNDASGLRVRADLARLASRSSQQFLTYSTVRNFLKGVTKLDYETSKVIYNVDKSLVYVERFVQNKVPIKKSDHIVALLCIFSEDSFGARILSDEFYDYIEELQERLNECKGFNYRGLQSAVTVMDFLSFSSFLEGKPIDVWFLLYNFFLHQEGMALILEDTDPIDSSLIYTMRYKVEECAKKYCS